jgi:outer membrane protein TolC
LAGDAKDAILGNSGTTLGSAFNELGNFNHQEWQLGMEFSMPLGFRRGHLAVQHAELQIARDMAVLREQERQVLHDLSNAKTEMERAFEQREINFNRWRAAAAAVADLDARKGEEGASFEALLDAQRRQLEAQTAYHLSAVEYEIAEKNVRLEKGSLLNHYYIEIDGQAPVETVELPPGMNWIETDDPTRNGSTSSPSATFDVSRPYVPEGPASSAEGDK